MSSYRLGVGPAHPGGVRVVLAHTFDPLGVTAVHLGAILIDHRRNCICDLGGDRHKRLAATDNLAQAQAGDRMCHDGWSVQAQLRRREYPALQFIARRLDLVPVCADRLGGYKLQLHRATPGGRPLDRHLVTSRFVASIVSCRHNNVNTYYSCGQDIFNSFYNQSLTGGRKAGAGRIAA